MQESGEPWQVGADEGRPRQVFVQVVLEPLLGFMLLTLGAVAVATGMVHAVLLTTTRALIETMAVVAAAALLNSPDDLAMCRGEMGVALQVFWCKGDADVT